MDGPKGIGSTSHTISSFKLQLTPVEVDIPNPGPRSTNSTMTNSNLFPNSSDLEDDGIDSEEFKAAIDYVLSDLRLSEPVNSVPQIPKVPANVKRIINMVTSTVDYAEIEDFLVVFRLFMTPRDLLTELLDRLVETFDESDSEHQVRQLR